MPALPREFNASLLQQGYMIYGGQLGIPANQQTNVERAFERYRETLTNAVSGAPAPAPPTSEPSAPSQPQTSSRPNLTTRITEALTSTPAGLTIAQVARRLGIKDTTVTSIVTRQVTSGAYVKEGNKYRMSTGAVPAQPAAAAPAPSRQRSRQSGSGALDRVVNMVMQRPGITKAEVITAMAPARANHVGIWLSRLCKANRITGTQDGTDGPYYPTANAQRAAA